jgi:hypothetical protein
MQRLTPLYDFIGGLACVEVNLQLKLPLFHRGINGTHGALTAPNGLMCIVF